MAQQPEPETTYYVEQPPKKSPWGCILGGCLGVILLIVLGSVATVVGGYWYYKSQLAKYTSDSPRELPVVEPSDEEVKAVEAKLETFKEKIENEEQPETLILTADDINAMISKDEDLRGRVYVEIEDGQIKAEVSFPLDDLPGAKGRYFNGSVKIDARLENEELYVTIDEAEVNGTAVPDDIMQGFSGQNLAKDVTSDPDTAEAFGKIESFIVEDDRIVITPRVKKSSPNDDSKDAAKDETNGDSIDEQADESKETSGAGSAG